MHPKPLPKSDARLTVALFTSAEVARYVRVPPTTLGNWVRGYHYPVRAGLKHSESLIQQLPASGRRPRIPFIGLAEALVISAFKGKRIPMQTIRAALTAIEDEIGLEHALATKSVYTAGASILWDYAQSSGDEGVMAFIEPGSGQRVFTEAVRQYLELITYDSKLWAERVYLPGFAPTRVMVDMQRGFGQPILEAHRLRIEDITDRFYFGRDSTAEIAADLELDVAEVENVIRVAWRPAAAA